MELGISYDELARATGGRLTRGNGADKIHSICLDSRKIAPNQVFWPLRGERFDAHDFLDDRLAKAADGWVMRQGTRLPASLPAHLVEVPETRKALGDLAAYHRRRFDIPVVGITGSNGKTTTKEMLRSILLSAGPVCANSGNYNNEIGLPLTVLELGPEARFAVFEMGASKAGDIAYLCRIAQPTLGILTNIGTAHLEFFGSLEGTFRAKSELVDGVKAEGPMILNLDDPLLAGLAERLGPRAVTFGRNPRAWARILDCAPGYLDIQLGSARIHARMEGAGRIHRLNAAAAAAAAASLGFALEAIRRGLESFAPAPMRFQSRKHASGAWLVVDAYNANPESMRAGIETFLETAGKPELLLVLGDMKELGPESGRFHRDLGLWLARRDLGGVYLAGPEMAEAAGALAEARFPVRHAPEPQGLLEALRPRLKEGVAVYFKASRAMRMETLIERL